MGSIFGTRQLASAHTPLGNSVPGVTLWDTTTGQAIGDLPGPPRGRWDGLATNVAFVRNLPYDPRKDLTPIAGATLTNHVLVVKAGSPIRSFADFIAHAKKNPGKVSIGYSTSIVQLQIANNVRIEIARAAIGGYQGQDPVVADSGTM